MINILIPMAGRGSRFAEMGYKLPKPLIDVNGMPMIELVFRNLNMDGHYIFIALKEHEDKYNVSVLLKSLKPDCDIIYLDSVTDGACRTALMAQAHIDNDSPLIISNSDQLVKWDSSDFLLKCAMSQCDGSIVTLTKNETKYSYARMENGLVVEVAEKKVISDRATAGIYYYQHGSDFVKFAKRMIGKDIRTNNEFYICPVYNEFILDGKNITEYRVERMDCLGNPEDLRTYMLGNR